MGTLLLTPLVPARSSATQEQFQIFHPSIEVAYTELELLAPQLMPMLPMTTTMLTTLLVL
jgi:hypothetical protein